MAAPKHNARCLYVYAVVPSTAELPVGVRGVDGEALALVRCGALAAVVGAVSEERVLRTPASLLSHHAVVEAVRKVGDTLPVRFGTVMCGEVAVAEKLSRQRELLLEDLARLGSMVELDLAVLTTSPALGEGETVRITPLVPGRKIRGSGAGARYLRGRLRAHAKVHLFEERLHAARSLVDERLAPHAREVCWSPRSAGRIACIAAYLVHPGSMPEFLRAFERLCGERQELRLMLGQPTAPYSFVTGAQP